MNRERLINRKHVAGWKPSAPTAAYDLHPEPGHAFKSRSLDRSIVGLQNRETRAGNYNPARRQSRVERECSPHQGEAGQQHHAFEKQPELRRIERQHDALCEP